MFNVNIVWPAWEPQIQVVTQTAVYPRQVTIHDPSIGLLSIHNNNTISDFTII